MLAYLFAGRKQIARGAHAQGFDDRARPMPCPPPVTRATRPSRSFAIRRLDPDCAWKLPPLHHPLAAVDAVDLARNSPRLLIGKERGQRGHFVHVDETADRYLCNDGANVDDSVLLVDLAVRIEHLPDLRRHDSPRRDTVDGDVV